MARTLLLLLIMCLKACNSFAKIHKGESSTKVNFHNALPQYHCAHFLGGKALQHPPQNQFPNTITRRQNGRRIVVVVIISLHVQEAEWGWMTSNSENVFHCSRRLTLTRQPYYIRSRVSVANGKEDVWWRGSVEGH